MKKLILCCFLLVGCGGLHGQYVQADRSTYNAIWPQVDDWLRRDTVMSDDDKEDIDGLGRSWEARIERAEESLKNE